MCNGKHHYQEDTTIHQHRIDIEQNTPQRIELLRAQRYFYSRAKLYQNWFAILALVLPVIGVIFGTYYPVILPYLGLGSIAILLLDITVLSPKQRDDCKLGAKVQEQFDTEVLNLDWNRLVAGKKVDAETVRAVTTTPITDTEMGRLKNWYEPVVSNLPLPVGRLACQRTNVTYDTRVREAYASALFWLSFVLFLILTIFGIYQGLKIDVLILAMYLPALPFVNFLLREQRKQRDTIEDLSILKTEVERLWDLALAGTPFDELTQGSRTLQDAIYRHRANNPLVFDWLYSYLRKKNEDLARFSVEKMVAEAEQKLKILEAHETSRTL